MGVRIDVHRHVWTRPLIDALSARHSLPRVVRVADETVLEIAGEASSIVDLGPETRALGRGPVVAEDLDLVVVAISSPLGIEALPRQQALALIEAHLAGIEALGPRFAAWGPIPLDRPDPDDVDRVLDRGCVGISLPASSLANPRRLAVTAPLLDRIADRGVPLFLHPGPAPADRRADGGDSGTGEPRWWAPLTSYVTEMQAAWLSFATVGRSDHPQLTVVFAMLAGGGPLLSERLWTRGGPSVELDDPLTFYDTSSFGPAAIEALSRLVGEDQLVYGSDRPVVEPVPTARDAQLQENAARLLSPTYSHV